MKHALYSKLEMTEDGNRAADLNKFASMDGWNIESDAAQMLSNVGIKKELHTKLMSELSNNEKVHCYVGKGFVWKSNNLLLREPPMTLTSIQLLG